MNRFYEDEFIFLEDDLERSLVYYCYKVYEGDNLMNDEDYRKSMRAYSAKVALDRHKKLLVNTTHSKFSIVPETQEWTAQEIAPLTTSLERMAFVMNSDIFSRISLEQLMEEDNIASKYSAPRYFETEEEAIKWLFE